MNEVCVFGLSHSLIVLLSDQSWVFALTGRLISVELDCYKLQSVVRSLGKFQKFSEGLFGRLWNLWRASLFSVDGFCRDRSCDAIKRHLLPLSDSQRGHAQLCQIVSADSRGSIGTLIQIVIDVQDKLLLAAGSVDESARMNDSVV
jgi:hypothetical protein